MGQPTVSNEELAKSRPGATQEKSGGLTGEAGLYRHPGSKEEVGVKSDPLYGNAQAEAVVRMGFERVSDLPEDYEKTQLAPSFELEAVAGRKSASVADVKGISARLDLVESNNNALEAENARLRERLATGDQASFPGQENVKRDAAAKVAADQENQLTGRDDTGVEVPEGGEGDGEETPEKPLSKQNSSELKATAEAEGVELTDDLDTNKKLAAAIQEARDNKESEN